MRRTMPVLALLPVWSGWIGPDLIGVAHAQTNLPIDRNRIDLNRPEPAPERPEAPAVEAPAVAAQVDADEQAAVPIRSIRFEGTKVPAVVAWAAEPFVGQPADKATLQKLVAAMSEAYGRSPVALFTILIPAQDLSGGVVRVRIGEGYVEGVTLAGEVEGRKLDLVKAYAERLTREKPVSRRTMERYLSLIRDIPGLKIDAKLQMGQTPGGVRLVLTLDYLRPTLTASFDNRTTQLVRDGQFQATGKFYGLLREGDYTELTASSSVDFTDYRYVGLSHSTPIGSEGVRLIASAGYIETRPPDSLLRGKAKTAGLTMSWPMIRGSTRNLTLSAAVDGVNSDNAALGSIIASERTRAARIAAGYGQTKAKTSLSFSLAVSRGLDMLGARVMEPLAETGFMKVNGRAGLDQAIGKRFVFRLRASGQWSRDRLPAVERFSVGGADFGRAFESALVTADRGVAGSAELAVLPITSGKWARTEVYGFADMAKVRLLPRGAFTGADIDLGSAGGGVRLAWNDKARLELEASRSIDRPYAGYDGGWRFSVGWRLSLRR